MAVVSANEIFDGREGDSSSVLETTYTRCWTIEVDSAYDEATSIYLSLAGGTLPRQLERYPNNNLATCRKVRITQGQHWRHWKATATYSTAPLTKQEQEAQESGGGDNPLGRPPRVSLSSELYERPIEEDKDGDAILNSAGDPFDPPPLVDDVRFLLRIEKNISTAGFPTWVFSYANSVNSDQFSIDAYPGTSIPARYAKVQRVECPDAVIENFIEYVPLRLDIAIRTDKDYVLRLLDAGFRFDDAGTKKLITNEDADGNPQIPSEPVLLDGSGGVLSDPTPSNAEFLSFYVYPEKTFGGVLPGLS